MANDPEFVQRSLFLLSSLGLVEAKRMFGGHGLFLDGVMIALIASDGLFLKVDEDTMDAFASAGSKPFIYNKRGEDVAMSYWRAPEKAMADPGAMEPWANRAAAAAKRAAGKKKKKAGAKRKPKLSTHRT